MTEALKTMISSKKHLVALIGILLIAANKKWSLGMSEEDIEKIIVLMGALILGQAASDAFGKGKFQEQAKLNSKLGATTSVFNPHIQVPYTISQSTSPQQPTDFVNDK